jgi:hypothetical protein
MDQRDVRVFVTLLFVLGVLAAYCGLHLMLYHSFPLPGPLPGDIDVPLSGGNLYLPIGSSIVISAVLTLIAWFIDEKITKK